MTVSSQVKTCLASLKGAEASLKQFAMLSQEEEAKKLFDRAAKTTQEVIKRVEERVQKLEREEPQYKGY